MEPGAPSVQRRLDALRKLHDEGINTYLFISPIFPYITNIRQLIEEVHKYVDKICFENLNLRGTAKSEIIKYISDKYPQYLDKYKEIYERKNITYWTKLEKEIDTISNNYEIPFVNYFYHDKIKKGAKKNDWIYG